MSKPITSNAPVVPNDFKATISDATAQVCDNFINTILKLPTLIWRFMNWAYDSSGNISSDALAQIFKPGFITMAGMVNAEDDNWLLCNGQEVPKGNYPRLYLAIGDTFGAPSNSNNFVIPKLDGRSPMGYGTVSVDLNDFSIGVGENKGEVKHTLIESEIPEISFPTQTPPNPADDPHISHDDSDEEDIGVNSDPAANATFGGDEGHYTVGPVIGLAFYIATGGKAV